ncbi:MAG TPA: hypothetical protein VKT82_15915 [Ktedonobacterales bacterium]|nr:hypothetical protein [Ktedonobacterales bacterium]
MQQFCNTCGAPITAGMTACARCGTPVTTGGGGAYDPTVRAGSPPGSAYGSQPYGPPPTDPYGAPPPPPPYGSQPYGSQPQPGYGAPPPPPGFGPPPQPGFVGGPQQPFMAPPPQPKKSRTWLYVVLGIVVVILLVCGGAAYAISRAVNNVANTVATTVATVTIPATGTHITNVQIGKGDDQGNITTKTSSFTQSDTIVIDYTATASDTTSQVALKVLASDGTELTGGPPPQDLENGQHDYFFAITITGADSYTAELDYNGTAEASIPFTVA